MLGDRMEVVFLDVGGTLAWSEPSAGVIWARVLEEHGHAVTAEDVIRRVGGEGPEFNRPDIARVVQATWDELQTPPFPRNQEEQAAFFRRVDLEVLGRLGVPVNEDILDTAARRFRDDVRSHAFEDTLPALDCLRDAGYRLGVISNATHDLPDGLERLGLASHFEATTYSWEAGAEKPDPRIFRTALSRMGVEADRAVHVGDSYRADIVGARRGGLTPILLQREGGPERDCLTVRSLLEVPDLLEEG